jgi:hypothetical protein
MLKQDLCWIPVRLNSFETLSEFYQCPDLGLEVNVLLSWHHIHKNHSLTVPEDSNVDLSH